MSIPSDLDSKMQRCILQATTEVWACLQHIEYDHEREKMLGFNFLPNSQAQNTYSANCVCGGRGGGGGSFSHNYYLH